MTQLLYLVLGHAVKQSLTEKCHIFSLYQVHSAGGNCAFGHDVTAAGQQAEDFVQST